MEALARCRLAQRQGLLVGDLCNLQRMALIAVIEDEQNEAERERVASFKAATLAANLDKAAKVLEMFDQIEREQASGGFAKPEEMQELTVSEKQAMLREFEGFFGGG